MNAVGGQRYAGIVEIRGFDESIPMALMQAREAVMRRFRPILDEHNISEQQWRVLRALNDCDTPLSAGELADRTFLLGPSLSRMLVSLEEKQLILRATAPDGRTSEIRIAPGGRSLVATVGPVSEAAYADIEQRMGAQELNDLLFLLARLTKLDEPDEPDHNSSS